jgi:hypothetical protein
MVAAAPAVTAAVFKKLRRETFSSFVLLSFTFLIISSTSLNHRLRFEISLFSKRSNLLGTLKTGTIIDELRNHLLSLLPSHQRPNDWRVFTPLEITDAAPSRPEALPPGQEPLWGGAWASGYSGITF